MPPIGGRCCCDGITRTVPNAPAIGWIFATSNATCKFMGDCARWGEGKRIVTSFDIGRTFKTPILKLGVSCIAAISNEKVSCTEVCIPLAGTGACGCGCGLGTGGAGALATGAGGVWVVSGMVAGMVG